MLRVCGFRPLGWGSAGEWYGGLQASPTRQPPRRKVIPTIQFFRKKKSRSRGEWLGGAPRSPAMESNRGAEEGPDAWGREAGPAPGEVTPAAWHPPCCPLSSALPYRPRSSAPPRPWARAPRRAATTKSLRSGGARSSGPRRSLRCVFVSSQTRIGRVIKTCSHLSRDGIEYRYVITQGVCVRGV